MKYNPALDGLRALAAIMVLLFHAGVPGSSAGFLGVDVFFVLSGYLITQILIEKGEKGNVDYLAFLSRRVGRLYPALLLFLIGYLVAALTFLPAIPITKHVLDLVSAGLYGSDLVQGFGGNIDYIRHTWTLGVEMKFYVLWPFVVASINNLERKMVVRVLFFVFVFATGWRGVLASNISSAWDVYYRFDTHSTGLILGSLLAYSSLRLDKKWWVVGAAGMALSLYLAAWRGNITAVLGFTVAELSAAVLICSTPSFLGGFILPWLGKMSYGFYLWHYLFVQIARELDCSWVGSLMLSSFLGLGFAALSYYTVESWHRHRRRGFSTKDKFHVLVSARYRD